MQDESLVVGSTCIFFWEPSWILFLGGLFCVLMPFVRFFGLLWVSMGMIMIPVKLLLVMEKVFSSVLIRGCITPIFFYLKKVNTETVMD